MIHFALRLDARQQLQLGQRYSSRPEEAIEHEAQRRSDEDLFKVARQQTREQITERKFVIRNRGESMMKSGFTANVLSVLAVVAVSAAVGTMDLRAQTSPTGKQNQSSGTEKQATVELTTDPSPAQKGSNTVRVKLTDWAGAPITGAQVAVTFSMPAMPTMGMAAMKTVIKATEAGGGMYEGKGDLGSEGTWQVTITAQQDGKTIANKRLTVKATGGM
jgi:nitrogen fixation protein FixH